MLNWCSCCQHFIGETPPYDRFDFTHGICTACEPNAQTFTKLDSAHTQALKDIHGRLFEAGKRNDLNAAQRIIDDAAKANLRGVDILLGLIAPMLYEIGEDWRRGLVTMLQEHQFTAFCEATFALVAAAIPIMRPADTTHAGPSDALLINAPGNRHTLAIRIIGLALVNKGVPANVVNEPLDIDDAVALVSRARPGIVMISMALAEQAAGVFAIAERIAASSDRNRPRIIVGGYAVKQRFFRAIPGVELMADINSFDRPSRSVAARSPPHLTLINGGASRRGG